MRNLSIFLLAILWFSSSIAQVPRNPSPPIWIGKNADTLVKEWGKPDLLIRSSDGISYYYIYNTQSSSSYPPTATPTVATSVSPQGRPVIVNIRQPNVPSSFPANCRIIFKVNLQKTILASEVKGDGC